MRKVIWCVYGVPLTILLVGATIEGATVWTHIIDALVSAPALIALHLHIWNKKFLAQSFWKPYAIAFLAWEIIFNVVLEPTRTGNRFDPTLLVVPLVFLPFYVAVVKYAFRSWPSSPRPDYIPSAGESS